MIIVLTLAAFLAATLSGIIGMGGGMLLLATMFCFLPHGQAIPLHAAVQIVSNGSRVVAFRKNVHWQTVGRFALGVVPGALVAGSVLWALGESQRAEPYLKMIIGCYILAFSFLHKPKETAATTQRQGFALLGLAAGLAALTVGAVGPLIAPLFLRRGFAKDQLIATKAVCQMVVHIIKVPAFGLLGTIQFAEFSLLLVCMAVAAILGTVLGKRLLRFVSPSEFVLLYRLALATSGIKVLVVDGILPLFSAE